MLRRKGGCEGITAIAGKEEGRDELVLKPSALSSRMLGSFIERHVHRWLLMSAESNLSVEPRRSVFSNKAEIQMSSIDQVNGSGFGESVHLP